MGYDGAMSDFDEVARQAGLTPTPSGGPPPLEPKRIKVFGVLHIVFGSLGLLQVLMNLAMMPFQEKLMTMSAGGSEDLAGLQLAIADKLKPYTWIAMGLGVIVAGMILRAGIGLVTKKKNSLAASNQYAWVSIGVKLLSLVLFVVLVLPAYNEMFESMVVPSAPGGGNILMVMKVSASIGGIVGPVLMCVYPILALVMLNKPLVKDFLAAQSR